MVNRIVYSKQALQKISEAILQVKNQVEVGGVLLGHRLFHSFFVIDTTIPNDRLGSSQTSFLLDGIDEYVKAKSISMQYYIKPKPIGVWHSHIWGIPDFSQQDRVSNQNFAQVFGPSVSAIAIPNMGQELERMISYHIAPKKEETYCAPWAVRIPAIFIRRK